MQSAHFEGFAKDEDGTPVLMFTAELLPHEDLHGKFNVQFGAAQNGEDVVFAIVTKPGGTTLLDYDEPVAALLDDLIEKGRYRAAIDYENRGWDELAGGYATVLMGRDFGKQFDVVQPIEFPTDDVDALREVRDELQEKNP